MGRSLSKAQRLDQMKTLYRMRSYSDAELAQRLEVDRTTVYRDRLELEKVIPVYEEEAGRYRIDRSKEISNVRLGLTEALSLYLAARRMSQHTRHAQSAVAKALEKLSLALHQPMTEKLVKDADEILTRMSDPRREVVFEMVARAWIEQLTLRIEYRSLTNDQREKPKTHIFSPYLIEPSPWSDGVYLIGYAEDKRSIITLKLERIESAMLQGPFRTPADFDEKELLKHAWGIWSSRQPVHVRLRFAPGLPTRRIKESIWHPLERVSDLPDGGCLWEAQIAVWIEMAPWVRGWGADVEVLEPPEFREHMRKEVQRLRDLYPPDAVPGPPTSSEEAPHAA
jgi:CRISPR-associated endonuclease/helicase Cas3